MPGAAGRATQRRLPANRSSAGWRRPGRQGQAALASRPFELEWDTTRGSHGAPTLEVFAFVKGRLAARTQVSVRLAN